jgi:hypothetical protein
VSNFIDILVFIGLFVFLIFMSWFVPTSAHWANERQRRRRPSATPTSKKED